MDGANFMMRALKRYLLAGAAATRIDKLFRPAFGGVGAILMLHRVVENDSPIIQRNLVVTVRFLDKVINYVKSAGYDVVTLDEAWRRVTAGGAVRKFVCFTFDDGYADSYLKALPVFQRHRAPMTVYMTTGMLERTADYWWGALERVILRNESIAIANEGECRVYTTRSVAEKAKVYDLICSIFHSDMRRFRPMLDELLHRYRADAPAAIEEDALTKNQLRALAAGPLVEIGAHGVTHRPLSHLSLSEARQELLESRSTLEELLGTEIRHFAYPFGTSAECGEREFELARECGFTTATTTRNGNLFKTHSNCPCALPRLPTPYGAETLSAVRMQLSGLPSLAQRVSTFNQSKTAKVLESGVRAMSKPDSNNALNAH